MTPCNANGNISEDLSIISGAVTVVDEVGVLSFYPKFIDPKLLREGQCHFYNNI